MLLGRKTTTNKQTIPNILQNGRDNQLDRALASFAEDWVPPCVWEIEDGSSGFLVESN